MALNPDAFLQHLSQLIDGRPLCIAYSGGIDSHVLLHLIATHQSQFVDVRAVYVDHQLHVDSSSWAQHCLQQARYLNVPFKTLTVTVENTAELGTEAAARHARYSALQRELADDEVLVTAQHADDQAETILLQLLRGAGPTGLSGMGEVGHWQGMSIVRPLLSETRVDIETYAATHQLQWIDDPSNAQTDFDRNFLRHEILPTLKQRWPSTAMTLSRSAQHCAEATTLMSELAAIDALNIVDMVKNTLAISPLLALPHARQRNLVRWLLMQRGWDLPSTKMLDQLLTQVAQAADDAQPTLSWGDIVVRRHKARLYFEEVKPQLRYERLTVHSLNDMPLDNHRTLVWDQAEEGLKKTVVEAGLSLRYRQGGEKIRLKGHSMTKSLKHCFQEWDVPVWLRESVPLLFDGDTMVAVVGYAVAEGYGNDDGEQGWCPSVRMDVPKTF